MILLTRSITIIVLALMIAIVPSGWATILYDVNIDTTGLAGLSDPTGFLAFDLISGDGVLGNNTTTVTSLTTNGVLSDSSDVVLQDSSFFNEELRDITFGTFLSFTIELTENAPGGVPDQFSFFLLDSAALFSLVSTTDPTGADALFAIDIDGTLGGTLSVFDSNTANVSWTVTPTGTPIPEPSTGLMVVIAVLLAFIVIPSVRRICRV